MSRMVRPSDMFKSEDYRRGYMDGHADGSTSVTEEIISKKVVKYLKEKKEQLTFFETISATVLIDELTAHFQEGI